MKEQHPFLPFLPVNAQILMLGTFPPDRKRWCMDFYYPNYQNDMWRIFGLCFFGDKNRFLIEEEHRFRLNEIRQFLCDEGIALFDTATEVVRSRNTASDKDLCIVKETDTDSLLMRLPLCRTIVATGQLAAKTVADHYCTSVPKLGEYVELFTVGRSLRLYRMPSSSRAYPMPIEKKTEYYAKVFRPI